MAVAALRFLHKSQFRQDCAWEKLFRSPRRLVCVWIFAAREQRGQGQSRDRRNSGRRNDEYQNDFHFLVVSQVLLFIP